MSMSTMLPDVERVRTFLRAAGATPAGIERLEVSYLSAGPRGVIDVLYEGAGPGDEVVRLAARPMAPAEGKKVAAMLNRRHRGGPRATDLPHAALYAPELAAGENRQGHPAIRAREAR